MNEKIVSLAHPKLTKVYLRPLEKTDMSRCCRWVNDPETRSFYSTELLLFSTAQEERWFEDLQKKTADDITLAIITKEDDIHIGNMGIRVSWKNRHGTTGALIGEKDFWGKGYGTEAKLLFLKLAFDEMGLQKVCSHVYATNPRSKAYLEKTGYHEEGVLRRHVFLNGRMVDVYEMAVFREDFIPIWKKYTGEDMNP